MAPTALRVWSTVWKRWISPIRWKRRPQNCKRRQLWATLMRHPTFVKDRQMRVTVDRGSSLVGMQ